MRFCWPGHSPPSPGTRLLEAGCGAGAALLCAAHRLGDCELVGLERDQSMLALARRNIELNTLGARVTVESGDVASRHDDNLNQFDQVFANPPYFKPGAIQAVHPGREGAYMAHTPLEDWLKFMLHTVKPGGRVTLIHRAGELARILTFMDTRFGQIEVLPVRSRAGMMAKRVLVTGRKGLRRGETVLHAGLTLYENEDQLSPRALSVQSGGTLEWR